LETAVAVLYVLIALYTLACSPAIVGELAREMEVSPEHHRFLVYVVVVLGSTLWPAVYFSYLYQDYVRAETSKKKRENT
jgi:Mn2+/Fe2+ NRAMP family transporter